MRKIRKKHKTLRKIKCVCVFSNTQEVELWSHICTRVQLIGLSDNMKNVWVCSKNISMNKFSFLMYNRLLSGFLF